MRATALFALPALLILAACGTPQERCVNAAGKDLRTVNALIQETRLNLSRGYGYTEVLRSVPQYVDCTPAPTEANPEPAPQMCLVDSVQSFQEPVAIDLVAEEAKLKGLLTKQAELSTRYEEAAAACAAAYPE